MEDAVTAALHRAGIADITTIGRKSGQPRRIEIYFHHLGGEFFITGRPGHKRDWLANLIANPGFTLHLKRGVSADVKAVATAITEDGERAEVLRRILLESWDNPPEKVDHILPRWVATAPLVSFTVE